MSGKFTPVGQPFHMLPQKERAERYRQFATDLLQKAQQSVDPDQKAEYFAMASGWHTIAVESERAASAGDPASVASAPPHHDEVASDKPSEGG